MTALREVLRQLLQFEQPLRHLVSLMYALDTRYDTGAARIRWPADGARPGADRGRGAGGRTGSRDSWSTSPGMASSHRPARLAGEHSWRDRVDYVTAAGALPPADGAPAAALLIRPDGYVAWAAAPDDLDPDGLRHALSTWFGS